MMVVAHADDETLLAGGLISKLVSDGQDVRVLCLAPGNEDRAQRLRYACGVLGVNVVETLRYSEGAMWPDEVDKSMCHTRRNLDPQLAVVPVAEMASRIGGRITEFEPDVVITHSSYGDYGHADHAVVYQATKLAVETSGLDGTRLYALEWPRWLVQFNARLMSLSGRDIRRMGSEGQFNLPMSLRESTYAEIVIDVSEELRVRRIASRWYASEIARGPLPLRLLERMPLIVQRVFLGKTRLCAVIVPEGFDIASSF